MSLLFTMCRTPGLFQTFYGRKATYFYLGRGAVWQAIKLLHLNSTDKVLVPSYHCGVEIEATLQANVEVEFYKVNEDMSVNLSSLKNKLTSRSKTIYVIHYYGFTQPIEDIRNLCKEHDLFLIEDCAHALFSTYQGQSLGTYGDISIFSLQKSLPTPDGGALFINNQDIVSSIHIEKPHRAVIWKNILSHVFRFLKNNEENSILSLSLRKIKKLYNGFLTEDVSRSYSSAVEFDRSMGRIGMSTISQRIMDGTPFEVVIFKRRFNYQYLLERIKETDIIKVCFPFLPDGTCPLFFPVRITSGQRKEVQSFLQRSGIQTFVFGEILHSSLPRGNFPEAESLSKEILCIPIHQDLVEEDLDFMIKEIKKFGAS